MSRRRLAVLVVAAGVLGSQAGHLLAYTLRFGGAAGQLQSTGAHAYFPTVAKTGLGIASLALLTGLLIAGMARLIARKPVPDAAAPSFVLLLAAVYTLQLGLFALQETAEAVVGGAPAGSAPSLLLWGAVGQLPVAIAASLAVRWLLVRVRPALAILRARPTPIVVAAPVVIRTWPVYTVPATVDVVRRSFVRGPPSS